MPNKKTSYRLARGRAASVQDEDASGTSIYSGEPVRTTIDLEPELHRKLKVYAAHRGLSISQIFRSWVTEFCK